MTITLNKIIMVVRVFCDVTVVVEVNQTRVAESASGRLANLGFYHEFFKAR